MSQQHRSIASIEAMLDRGEYKKSDIMQALADLEAMKKNIKKHQYEAMKALLQAKL